MSTIHFMLFSSCGEKLYAPTHNHPCAFVTPVFLYSVCSWFIGPSPQPENQAWSSQLVVKRCVVRTVLAETHKKLIYLEQTIPAILQHWIHNTFPECIQSSSFLSSNQRVEGTQHNLLNTKKCCVWTQVITCLSWTYVRGNLIHTTVHAIACFNGWGRQLLS